MSVSNLNIRFLNSKFTILSGVEIFLTFFTSNVAYDYYLVVYFQV